MYDPKALHQVVVKNQDVFEETPWFIAYAHRSFPRALYSCTSSWNTMTFGPGLLSTMGMWLLRCETYA